MTDPLISIGAADARVVDKPRPPTGIERIPIESREQWLTLRLRDITASDVPAVCGEGLFGSPARVWAIKRGLLPPADENAVMQRGRWGEPAVFEALADEYPSWELRRAKVYLRDWAARLGATPDGAAIDPEREGIGIIQCKVVARPVFVRDWLGGVEDDDTPVQAPLAYQLQTLTEAMLADADWAVIAALVVDTFQWSLRLVPVERHARAEEMIRKRVDAFWRNYLDPGIQPPFDPERDEALVKTLFPRDDGTEIDLSADNRAPVLIDELADMKAAIKHFECRKKAIETEIKAKLGPHSYGRLGDGRVISHKQQHRSGYTVAPTSFRVLRISNA